jgi:uncharacterized membrane protein
LHALVKSACCNKANLLVDSFFILSVSFRMPEERPSPDLNTETDRPAAAALSDHITENIEGVVALQRREWDATSASQLRLERVSRIVGRPAYLVAILLLSGAWILFNSSSARFGVAPFDPPPFQWLELLVSFIALLTTTIVLIAQNRQTKFEQQRAHLNLQVNLLTEQKVTKVIHLIEELRRDLPMVKDRHDPQAAQMQERADTAQLASALDEVGLTKGLEERPPPRPPD